MDRNEAIKDGNEPMSQVDRKNALSATSLNNLEKVISAVTESNASKNEEVEDGPWKLLMGQSSNKSKVHASKAHADGNESAEKKDKKRGRAESMGSVESTASKKDKKSRKKEKRDS